MSRWPTKPPKRAKIAIPTTTIDNALIALKRADDMLYVAFCVMLLANLKTRDVVKIKYDWLFDENREWRKIIYHPGADRIIYFNPLNKKRLVIQRYCDFYEMKPGDYLFFKYSDVSAPMRHAYLKREINAKLKEAGLPTVNNDVIHKTVARLKRRYKKW